MDPSQMGYAEAAVVKTKIIATVGPACASVESLRELALAGADLFRLNFAHAEHDWLAGIVGSIREISAGLRRPIGILADLSGPKIRLGEVSDGAIECTEGSRFEFVREPGLAGPTRLTSNYEGLIDDVGPGDRILLADGTVSLRVVEKPPGGERIVCVVERPGVIRSRQGITLPGVQTSAPSLTDKDVTDLAWALEHEVDYVGQSFVRSAADIRALRAAIESHSPANPPHIIAKIEKMEALSNIESILDETDAVMVARGDLGVEVDVARVPALQKRIIRLCNQHRIPVITATQMLDSMQKNDFPTRAEASDVANAVLDGSDAVMLSGETAIGRHPRKAVEMMSRIVQESERLVRSTRFGDLHTQERSRARQVTEAVTLAAGTAAEHLGADLIVVATHSGRTAMAVSKQRSHVPILALSDRPATARRMCLYWGVTPLETDAVSTTPQELTRFVVDWGKRQKVLIAGSRIVVIGQSNWSQEPHDLMIVHAVT
ncbi:MAG: pyruvate kinase [Planctomycetaceae bacterium]